MGEDKNKKGIKIGAATAGTGGIILASRKVIKDNYNKKGVAYIKKYSPDVVAAARKMGTTPETIIKNSKVPGIAALTAGSTIVGVHAYKHYKNKKKKIDDDSTEK